MTSGTDLTLTLTNELADARRLIAQQESDLYTLRLQLATARGEVEELEVELAVLKGMIRDAAAQDREAAP